MFGAYSFGTPQFAEGDREQQYTLLLSPGSYSVTGSNAQLLGAFLLNLAPGSYAISGFDAAIQLLIRNIFRVHCIPFDNRNIIVPDESRTAVVPFENRTRVIPEELL